MPQISYFRTIILILILGCLYLFQLGAARLWDRDEPRNARASQEMLARGDWVVPTFNGALRDHKPILLYWEQMLGYKWLGQSEWTARLPSALCAVLAALSVGVLASRLNGVPRGISSEGFWSASVFSSCLMMVLAGRAATPDANLIAFSTLGIALLVIATLVPHGPYAIGGVGRARWIPALSGYVMLGLAVLAKGPVGVVIPLAVVHIWWLICRHDSISNVDVAHRAISFSRTVLSIWRIFNPLQFGRAIIALRTLPGVCVVLIVAVPWYYSVGVATDGEFLRGFFWRHNVERALGSMEGHGGSALFYPLTLLVGTFPWSLWFVPVLLWSKNTLMNSPVHRPLIWLAITWISITLGAFTIAQTKLPSYITSCYGGVALVVGCYWQQFASGWQLPSIRWRLAAHSIAMLVGLIISAAIFWLSQDKSMPQLAWVAMSGLFIFLAGLLGMFWEFYKRPQRIPSTWLTAACLFNVMLFGYGAPFVDGYRSELTSIIQLQSDIPQKSWLTIGTIEPSWVLYLDLPIEEVDASDDWQDALTEFLERNSTGRIVCSSEELASEIELALQEPSLGLESRQVAVIGQFMKSSSLRVYDFQPSAKRIPAELVSTPVLPVQAKQTPIVEQPPQPTWSEEFPINVLRSPSKHQESWFTDSQKEREQ
ncbi:MAG: glycosyltransferase family 39 protein [Planctomycetales bacterium]|nr:glycosyltransferase family 39 protein [Planctomycetales bacterium]